MKPERRGGRRNFWTAEDDMTLMHDFDRLSLADLCRKLGRDPGAIGARCGKLGITAREGGSQALHQAWFGVTQ